MTKLTIHEQLMLARRIKDDFGVLADYLWMDHDAHVNSSIERLEAQLNALILSFYDEDTYIVLIDNETGEKDTRHFEKGDIMGLCSFASKIYAFDDIDDTYTIEHIVCDGQELEYVGWQPGMLFEFRNIATGEIVYSNEFPNWDH